MLSDNVIHLVIRTFYIGVFLVTCLMYGYGQEEVVQDSTKSVERFRIVVADKGVVNMVDKQQVDSLLGNVILERDSVYLFADQVIITDKKSVVSSGNVSILHPDSIKVFSDSLFFEGDTDLAILKGNVVLEQNDEVLNTDKMDYYIEEEKAVFGTGAILQKENTTIQSRTGSYFAAKSKAYFYNEVVVRDSAFTLRTDTLIYDSDTEEATFRGPSLLITSDSAQIYTTAGAFDIGDNSAVFENNPQYTSADGAIASAQRIFYNGASKEIFLEGDAYIKNGQEEGQAVTINILEEKNLMILTGDASFTNSTSKVVAPFISVNTKTENIETQGGAIIEQEDSQIIADQITTDTLTGNQIALGNIRWQDTTQNLTLLADRLEIGDTSQLITAIGSNNLKPLLLKQSLDDSLFIVAEHLRFWDEEIALDSITKDTVKFFSGQHEVEIFGSGFQAKADSLLYDAGDSTLVLIDNPILWSDSLQISGDTIFIDLVNGQVDKLRVPAAPFVVIASDSTLHDQMKGNQLVGIFEQGKIDSMNIDGNAEAIYFMKDDENAFIGMNQNQCGTINLLFNKSDDLYKIEFVNNATNTMTSMGKVSPSNIHLSGYFWAINQKPQLLYFLDLLAIRNEQ